MVKDELPLSEEEKKLGISKILRDGSVRGGFAIEFTIHGSSFNVTTDPELSVTFNRLTKAIKRFGKPAMGDLDVLDSNLQHVILNHKDWMIGLDVKTEKSGYTVNAETTVIHTTSEDKTDDNNLSTYKLVSISDAIGMHVGKIQFEGVIASADTDTLSFAKEAHWKCNNCEQIISKKIFEILDIPNDPRKCSSCESEIGFQRLHEYINSRLLKIQSEDNTNDTALESLPVYVLDEYTKNIQISGRIKVYGRIAKRQNPNTKQFYTVIVAKFLEYKDRKKLEITSKNKAEIIRYSKRKTLEEDLINQFARNIIGENFAKLTIILSAIGAPELIHPETGRVIRRGRMHVLIIGPPGGGKTELLRGSQNLRINSKIVEGTNTSGGSLTSMILSEDGKLTLRLGVAATTVNAFLIINEFDKLPDEHKNAILEVMERGESILNKYAFLRAINAQTTVIASANPINGNWINEFAIDAKELPFPLQILSRFDSIIIFRRPKSKEEHKAFADACSNLTNEDLLSDPSLLQKYIEYARQIKNVTIDSDAKELLNEYYANLAVNKQLEYDVSNRTHATIYRCTEAFARFRLSDRVTKVIAQRTINHFNEMLNKLNLSFLNKLNPSIYAFDKTTEYIQLKTHNRSDAVNLIEAIQSLCLRDEIMCDYLGDVFNRNANNKLDRLCDKILQINKEKLGIVKVRPSIVYWKHKSGCKCDYCDERKRDECDQCVTQNPPPGDRKNFFHKEWFDKVASNELKNKKQKKIAVPRRPKTNVT